VSNCIDTYNKDGCKYSAFFPTPGTSPRLGCVVPPTVSEEWKAIEDLMNPCTAGSSSKRNSQWRHLNMTPLTVLPWMNHVNNELCGTNL